MLRRGYLQLLIYFGLIALVTFQIEATIVVQLNNGTQVEIESVEIIYIGTSKELLAEPISLEVTSDTTQVTDRIYVIKSPLAIDEIAFQVQQSGARAVIYISPLYYVGGYLRSRINDRQAVREIKIPVFEVPIIDGQKLWSFVQNNQIVNATILPTGNENPWDEVFSSPAYYLWPISLGLFCIANLVLCSWKMSIFLRHYGGFRASVSLVVLSIELISNLIRLAAFVDPFGTFGLYTEQAYAALLELSWPFSIASYLLFTLYWHEMMTSSTVVVHPFMVKMKIPFFVLSAFLVCLQITRTIIRNTSPFDSFTTVTAAIYLVVITGLLVFYGITGTKLLIRLNKSKNLGRAVNLRKSTIRILICGGMLVGFVIVVILFVAKIAYKTPLAFVLVWYFLQLLLNAISIMAILAFELPSKHSSASGSSRTNTSLHERKNSITTSSVRPDN